MVVGRFRDWYTFPKNCEWCSDPFSKGKVAFRRNRPLELKIIMGDKIGVSLSNLFRASLLDSTL